MAPRKRLGQILIDAGLLDAEKLNVGLREQQRWGGHLGRRLIDLKLVKEPDLVRVLSMQLNIPVAPDLDRTQVTAQVMKLLSIDFCQEHAVFPFRQDGRWLDVALVDPMNLSILDEIRLRVRMNVRPYIIGPAALERAIARWYKGIDPSSIGRVPSEVIGGTIDENPDFMGTSQGVRYIDLAAPAAEAGRPARAEGKSPHAETLERVAEAKPGVDLLAFEQLQMRVTQLEALLARDEAVIRKLLALMVTENIVSRDKILTCLQD